MSCRSGRSRLRHPVEAVLTERLAHVADLHLGMDAVLIDDSVHTPESGKYRLDITCGQGTAD